MEDAVSTEQEVVEHEVLSLLPDLEVDQLEELCGLAPVECPADSTGKKHLVLKLLFKHLLALDQSADKGFATYKVIHSYLTDKELISKTPHSEVKPEPGDGDTIGKLAGTKTETLVDVYKLKDFKISGIIGGPGEKDRLSYLSLSYQIENGKKLGYSDEKICGAVIRAVALSSHLRTYFESRPDLKLSSVQDILRSHFKEKDSACTFTELCNSKQYSTESCLDFVLRIMCLRQKVFQLSTEEGCAYNSRLLSKRFHQTLFSGLKNQNIRTELREHVKMDSIIADEELIKLLSEAVLNESERTEKFSVKKCVNVVETEIETKGNKDKKNTLPLQIEEMRSFHEREMSVLRADIRELKTVILGIPDSDRCQSGEIKRDNYTAPRYKNRKRCPTCEKKNWWRCFHCFSCGASNHRWNECPNRETPKN